MTLSMSMKSRSLQLWRAATLGAPQMPVRLLLWRRGQAPEAYPLHPRCCRTDHFLGPL